MRERKPRCRDHAERDAAARCAACRRFLCDECFRFTIDAEPACARCAYERSTRRARRLSLAVVFLGLSAALGTWATLRFGLWHDEPFAVIVGALAALGIAGVTAWTGLREAPPSVSPRERAEEATVTTVTIAEGPLRDGPYRAPPARAVVRRVVHAVSPRLSARTTALVMLGAFVLAALLVPGALRLPRWIEAELVLAAWWAIVGTTLTTLLYRGYRLEDDYAHFVTPRPRRSSGSTSPDLGDLSGCGDAGEGCVGAVAAIVLVVVLFGLSWLIVELVLPVVFLLAYGLFLRAIARVANDRHGCEGALGRALVRGWAWASLYVAPLALLVWVAHRA